MDLGIKAKELLVYLMGASIPLLSLDEETLVKTLTDELTDDLVALLKPPVSKPSGEEYSESPEDHAVIERLSTKICDTAGTTIPRGKWSTVGLRLVQVVLARVLARGIDEEDVGEFLLGFVDKVVEEANAGVTGKAIQGATSKIDDIFNTDPKELGDIALCTLANTLGKIKTIEQASNDGRFWAQSFLQNICQIQIEALERTQLTEHKVTKQDLIQQQLDIIDASVLYLGAFAEKKGQTISQDVIEAYFRNAREAFTRKDNTMSLGNYKQ